MTIRPAAISDVGMMLAIYAPYVLNSTASWESELPSRQIFAQRLQSCQDAGFPWLVAEQEGAILGYAYAARLGERSGYDWTTQVSVYVAEDARGRGLGTALYGALLAILKMQGYCSCYALVTESNSASVSFHKAMGFLEAASLPNAGFKLGKWLNLAYYYLPLNPCSLSPKRPTSFLKLDPQQLHRIFCKAQSLTRPD
ncbi:N-acetyltransferase family protein [uncultured Ruthenibacterium sp.]|uniref:GNAT family N-acetyltransferase n=1 Tax=uncultured Ruthenibacterium sp. TaxID=1905347 RepID=UPI00349EB390